MKTIYVTLFLILFLLPQQLLTNELEYATSPYLLQHADNPVDWMEWSKRVFEKAKKEHKAIFLSIGYSTCHWCHVMEKESFTNTKIANLLNKDFVSIKIDREELPHIDLLYQQLYKKHYGYFGGWPLNLFMTPDKKVFYITNYIADFNTLLPKLHHIFTNKKLLEKNIYLYMHMRRVSPKNNTSKLSLESLIDSIQKEFDREDVGFGSSKRFPQAAKTSLLLQLGELSRNKELQKEYFELLNIMSLRGLYDHVEGGFFRYSVDAMWEIPHFEKMLYTQAELIPLYVRGYLLKQKPLYKDVVQESIAMLDRYFLYKDCYLSASDADTKGEEGGYFLFRQKQIKQALQNNPHAKEIQEAMEFSFEGNFHDKVHINFYTKKRPQGFLAFQKELQKIRKKRDYPFVDKKINTAWNAMMIEALYKASVIDKKYAKKAKKHLDALTQLMFDSGELYHQSIPKKKPTQKGLLEDYAFFIGALIEAYEVEYDTKRLNFAIYLLQEAKRKFYKKGIWYLSDDGLEIRADLNDKYYTSAQSKILQDIIKLSALKASFSYEKLAQESLNSLREQLQKKQSDAPALASAYLMQKYGIIVLKSSQKNLQREQKNIGKINYPYIVSEAKNYDDYLACTLRRCFAKEREFSSLAKKIKMFKK